MALVAEGHHLTVICSHPVYPSWRVQWTSQNLDSIKIIRGGDRVIYPRSTIFRRAVLEIWYSFFVIFQFVKLKNKFDYIVVVMPPSLYVFFLGFFNNKKTKIIGVIHDLQGLHASTSDSLLGKVIKRLIKLIESRSFSLCYRLIFLSNRMARLAEKEYQLSESKCLVRYPFVTIDGSHCIENANLAKLFPDGHHQVVYSGALGIKQNPEQLYQFMANLNQCNKKIICHIFSAGPNFDQLKMQYQTLNYVNFHDLVDLTDLSELYMRSSIQIIPQAFGTEDGSLPSKLPNLLFAGVPILAVCESGSEVAEIVRKLNAGIVVSNWNMDEFAAGIDTLLVTICAEPRIHRRLRAEKFIEEKFGLNGLIDAIIM